MRPLSFVFLPLVIVACSNPPKPTDGGGGDGGGCPCTTGTTPRSGTVCGDRIQNYAFKGYLNTDPKTKTMSGTLVDIKLSDFKDPTGMKNKLLVIITSAGWCGPCIQETQFLAGAGSTPEKLGPMGVVFMQAIMEGVAVGTGSTQADLNDWIMKWSPNFTEVLDPEAMNLGAFSPASAVPFTVFVDARSMEILDFKKGFTGGPDLEGEVQTWLTWTMNNPPATACP
jgi:hypothetical protein